MKINYINLSLITLSFWLIGKYFGIELLQNLFGLVILYLTSNNIKKIFNFKSTEDKDLIEIFLANLTIYFFVITPVVYMLLRLGVTFNAWWIVFGYFLSFIPIALKDRQDNYSLLLIKKWFAENKNFILIMGLFVTLHMIFYRFYYTIPEWDSYSNLVDIEALVSGVSKGPTYRPLFAVSVAGLSWISHLTPYQLLSTILIALGSSLILVIYQITKEKKINEKFWYLLITLAVPVLNMEIDIPRPQSIFLIFLPIIIWYLYLWIEKKSIEKLIFLFLICLGGFFYHEFFAFPSLLLSIVLIIFVSKNIFSLKEKKDKLIFLLIFAIILLTFVVLSLTTPTIKYVLYLIEKVVAGFIEEPKWKWWFLGLYTNDSSNVGWEGIKAIIIYYAYYLSPIIFFIGIQCISNLFKKNRDNLFLRLIFLLELIFFGFSEILPRMEFVFLPERFWVFIGMLTIILYTWNYEKRLNIFKKVVISIMILLGITGSFYVAIGKKSLTTKEEMNAAEWIKRNTDKNSVFITQVANSKLVSYFGERKILASNKDFFLSDKIVDFYPDDYKNKLLFINKMAKNVSLENSISFSPEKTPILIKNISYFQNELLKFKNSYNGYYELLNNPKYILFSQQKFNNIYSMRNWWLEANYKGANLEKFNNRFPLVYNENGIMIWKME